MGLRIGILVLFLMGISWACDARQLVIPGLTEKVARNEKVCTLCKEYAAMALEYLAENKTQTQIIEVLHKRCSQMHNLKQQCIALVDYYAPLFFSQIESLQPEDFCRKVNLCEKMVALAAQAPQNSCEICQRTILEILSKLKDPDTELDIMELLLKGCKSIKNHEKQCKKLVFEYGPLFLVDVEKFLETKDVCTILHACPTKVESIYLEASVLAEF